jgi:hypothetical protein
MFHNLDKLPELLAALALAQKGYTPILKDKLVVQNLKDKQTGAYTGKSIKFYYADLAAVLGATLPALAAQGLSFIQPLQHDGEAVWIHSILAHASGAAIMSRVLVPGGGDLKTFGGNITYLRRYAAGPMLGVSSEDDADDDETPADPDAWENVPHSGPPAESARQPARKSDTAGASEGQIKNLQAKIKAAGLSDAVVQASLARLGIPAIAVGMSVDHWKLLKADIEKVI